MRHLHQAEMQKNFFVWKRKRIIIMAESICGLSETALLQMTAWRYIWIRVTGYWQVPHPGCCYMHRDWDYGLTMIKR